MKYVLHAIGVLFLLVLGKILYAAYSERNRLKSIRRRLRNDISKVLHNMDLEAHYVLELLQKDDSAMKTAAIAINKQKIKICVDTDDVYQTILYVFLHEIAHILHAEVGHDDQFWTLLDSICAVAREIGVLTSPVGTTSDICDHEVVIS